MSSRKGVYGVVEYPRWMDYVFTSFQFLLFMLNLFILMDMMGLRLVDIIQYTLRFIRWIPEALRIFLPYAHLFGMSYLIYEMCLMGYLMIMSKKYGFFGIPWWVHLADGIVSSFFPLVGSLVYPPLILYFFLGILEIPFAVISEYYMTGVVGGTTEEVMKKQPMIVKELAPKVESELRKKLSSEE
jgi:hypothetical protein